MGALAEVSVLVYRAGHALPLLGPLLVCAPLAAQQPPYRLELSGEAGLHHYSSSTELAETVGYSGRVGYWVSGPISLEGEVSYARPHTTPLGISVNTTTLAAWLVLNKPVGSGSSVFLRGGYGTTSYGSCAGLSLPGTRPCGSAGVIQGGIGARLGLTRNLLLRSDATVNKSVTTLKFSNITLGAGLSVMLGPTGGDSDQDGVPDRRDRCPNTARGTTVDANGCTLDADRDGVGDRFDRCPNTPAGLPVDISGCPSDGDHDGVPDGMDQCSDTPRNTAVDARGCPREPENPPAPAVQPPSPRAAPPAPVRPQPRDTARVPESAMRPTPVIVPSARDTTPKPVTVAPPPVRDTVRRPVPVTPPPGRDTAHKPAVVAPPPPARDTAAKRAPAPPTAPPARAAARTWVLPGSVWTYRAAILDASAFPTLDSIALLLKADPEARAEVIGHAYDRLIPADDVHLSQFRAEAVRKYLTFKGVPVSRITAVGRGSSPLIDRGATEEARTRNRRVEIRITYPTR